MASKVGYYEKAYDYFIKTARLDLDNTHGNTKDGVHTANMGGTWMSIVYGFAGLRIKEDYISLNPHLPKNWDELNFKFLYKGAVVEVEMKKESTLIRVNTSKRINLKVNEKLYTFTDNKDLEI
jgi:alpha,alpha-trehalose phosphorylase